MEIKKKDKKKLLILISTLRQLALIILEQKTSSGIEEATREVLRKLKTLNYWHLLSRTNSNMLLNFSMEEILLLIQTQDLKQLEQKLNQTLEQMEDSRDLVKNRQIWQLPTGLDVDTLMNPQPPLSDIEDRLLKLKPGWFKPGQLKKLLE